MASIFDGDFAAGLLSNFIAGAAIVLLAYLFIERRLHLRQEQREREDQRTARDELVRAVLGELKRELEYDADQAAQLVGVADEPGLPIPLFDVNGWTLLSQAPVLAAMRPETLEALVNTYNRLRLANERYAVVYDLLFGPTAILAVTTIESMPEGPPQSSQRTQFEETRREQMRMLVARVEEARPHIADSGRLVDAELARLDGTPARSSSRWLRWLPGRSR